MDNLLDLYSDGSYQFIPLLGKLKLNDVNYRIKNSDFTLIHNLNIHDITGFGPTNINVVDLYKNLPHNSFVFLESESLANPPADMCLINIYKLNENRGFCVGYGKYGGLYRMNLTTDGDLTGTWYNSDVINAIRYKDYTVSVNLKTGFNTILVASSLAVSGYITTNIIKAGASTSELRNYVTVTPSSILTGGNVSVYSYGEYSGTITFRVIYVRSNIMTSL